MLIQGYEDVLFSGTKWPICHEENFFGTNHYYHFHLPIGPFYWAKFKKRMHHFGAQNGPFAQNKVFFENY